ncbi:MAG: hypothetical protein WC975_13695 [Phycisphaerae bacterium]
MNKEGLDVAKKLADWLCRAQNPMIEMNGDAGRLHFTVDEYGRIFPGSQWNSAFAIMGWLGAFRAFGDERYLESAMGAARYLKSLQVFNPFMKNHYGAIREMTSQTTWCYPRDSISAGWAFIELYRFTNDKEWIERAKLFADWFLREALDEDGWPYWGVILEDLMEKKYRPQICNDVQGCFHGGSMNFFYQLAQATNENKWTGEFYIRMADYFVEYIQQKDGFFRSIERKTRKIPENDPQRGLHRANDDLGALGLLGAYKVTGHNKYLKAIEKFLTAVFANQNDRGMFDNSVAGIPVVLNIIHEAGDLVKLSFASDDACAKALQALYRAQELCGRNLGTYGGILEEPHIHNYVCTRSSCYSLIYLIKKYSGIKDYLSV